ncbi:MAG: aminoglycoside N(3)-acetyltransferase [Pseudomonadales bacterium]
MAKDSGEQQAMAATDAPVTPVSLARDLRALGVQSGMLLNVHSALSRLGWVVGGVQTVVQALIDVLGETGTLMMPSHSAQLSDPANWRHPPAPEQWWDTIRAEMPAYDPARTPTRLMGAIPEAFRCWPGVMRSGHPQTSHAALGPLAAGIVAEHPLDCLFGDASPIGKLYALDGHVLLLGVGHGNNTALHLAEDRASFPSKTRHTEGAPLVIDGERRWQNFRPLKVSSDDFPALGEAFAATGRERRGRIGAAEAILMRARDVVDFARPWFEANRR